MFIQTDNAHSMLESILESIDEAIHAVDENGITIFYNSVAAKHDGVTIEEVLGKHFLEVFPSLTKTTSTLLRVIETGKPIYNEQQTYKNIRGKHILTVNTTLPIKVKGKLVGAVEIAKDVTKIKELSEKLVDLQVKMNKKQVNKKTKTEENAKYYFNDILTENPHLIFVKNMACKIARTDSPVLVYGETGTGKELLVQSIHNASQRKNQPFIAQNCAALPAPLLESILFGTVKGSFTGAIDRQGLFELADQGTLFLDEINSMPLELQAKLLRVIEEGTLRRVGSNRSFSVDVRIITAINETPKKILEENQLRKDLYFRLNVVYLQIPPLRERMNDLSLLVHHFIKKYNQKFKKAVTHIDEKTLLLFESYHWPGNVRELEHAIESAMNIVDGDTIDSDHVPSHLMVSNYTATCQTSKHPSLKPLRKTLEEVEKSLIHQALYETNGNIQQAANLLEIPRQTLQYKLTKRKKHQR
ncbi:sigma-54 interaction domain-containing protein [Bacillus taeanensis]|uniref:Sigma-54-dependent Fis family transcriptional regulator n=1 Tax=Bacillus taeanensis TaxID=273032 RepID=A0A366XPP6_9BACI|nr:sigma 54-interacting transcriptional regulator [Bacillus taeanensis]RBW67706.1 sigma-54-dependent Fis family transcriptional regulator [Bacillus taeanensis]